MRWWTVGAGGLGWSGAPVRRCKPAPTRKVDPRKSDAHCVGIGTVTPRFCRVSNCQRATSINVVHQTPG